MFVSASVRYGLVFCFCFCSHFCFRGCTESFSSCGRLGESPETTKRPEVCGLPGIPLSFMSNYIHLCSYPSFPLVLS